MRVVFTGGGTGGHLFPIIAIARELRRRGNHECVFIGPDDVGTEALQTNDVAVRRIPAGRLRRDNAAQTAVDRLKIPLGVLWAIFHLFVVMPDIVVSKGGFGSAPVLLAAWLYNIPFILHESDSVPGLVTKKFARSARAVLLSFPQAATHLPDVATTVVGNPVRQTLLAGNAESAKRRWSIDGSRPVVLVMGGSQGAQVINELILEFLPRLLEHADVLHMTGPAQRQTIEAAAKPLIAAAPGHYVITGFFNEEELADAYRVATLAVSRAGAGSIFELAAAGKPSILIPLPSAAADHQRENARLYAEGGAAVVLEQENMEPNLLLDAITRILDDPQRQELMRTAALAFARPDAAEQTAAFIVRLASAASSTVNTAS